jgi:hypothetical protein
LLLESIEFICPLLANLEEFYQKQRRRCPAFLDQKCIGLFEKLSDLKEELHQVGWDLLNLLRFGAGLNLDQVLQALLGCS